MLAIVIGKQALTKKYLAGGESIIVKASKSEPMRHPRTTKTKLALIESSELARSTLLAKLETLLLPLEHSKSSDLITDAVARADELFATFVSNERAALVAYNARKLIVSKEKEKERRNLALEEKDRLQTTTKKYRLNKARIELAIAEAGESDWKDVTAKRIKGVTDIYRYKYFEVRSSLEEELGGEVAGEGVEKMTKAIARQEVRPLFFSVAYSIAHPCSTACSPFVIRHCAATTLFPGNGVHLRRSPHDSDDESLETSDWNRRLSPRKEVGW